MNGSRVEGCCLDRNPTSISRRSAAGKVLRLNPSAAAPGCARRRWHWHASWRLFCIGCWQTTLSSSPTKRQLLRHSKRRHYQFGRRRQEPTIFEARKPVATVWGSTFIIATVCGVPCAMAWPPIPAVNEGTAGLGRETADPPDRGATATSSPRPPPGRLAPNIGVGSEAVLGIWTATSSGWVSYESCFSLIFSGTLPAAKFLIMQEPQNSPNQVQWLKEYQP